MNYKVDSMKLSDRDGRLLAELAEWCTPDGAVVPHGTSGRLDALAAALGVAVDKEGRIVCEMPEVRAVGNEPSRLQACPAPAAAERFRSLGCGC
jgi:hypothetical protein